jgi:hypothetical protein
MNRHGVGVQLTVSDAPAVVDASADALGARIASRLSLGLAFGMIAALSVVSNAKAQEAEPRSYSNTPIGLNFLIAGYAYSQGKLAFDPNTTIATPHSAPTPGCWPMFGPSSLLASPPSLM